MVSGVRYRLASAAGTIAATVAAVLLANNAAVQTFATTTVPLVNRLQPDVLSGEGLWIAVLTTVVVVGFTTAALFKPRPRRILNAVAETQRRVLIAGLSLAAIGYFDYSYQLPRVTLLVTIGTLLVVLPAWFVAIRRPPNVTDENIVVVGDDPTEIERVADALSKDPVGYVAPSSLHSDGSPLTDGGVGLVGERDALDIEYLGGLSRLEEVLIENDIDTTVFAFATTNRQEFFGALGACHDHGVAAKIHRKQADSVLVADEPGDELVDINVEPWDWQDRAVKRLFDVAFAATGLLVLAPVMFLIGAAIKLEDGGPLLYSQERTAELGETFDIYKFRSMQPESEDVEPGEDEARITTVGRVLRQTHLDEIPQLWSILVGDMSVVGPRATWTDEEHLLETEVSRWRQRWFVKPGLTGLAQINDSTSEEPEKKLRYDIEYIRKQSFRYDLAIVIRQLWKVLIDIGEAKAELFQRE